MTTLYFTHPVCVDHEPGQHHPECPDRLRAINGALEGPHFADLEKREAPLAERAQIALAHPQGFVDFVLDNIPNSGYRAFDGDTIVNPSSGEATLRAAGAVTAAIDAVVAGEARNAFCGVRPPGHHAEPTRAMGFCLFNSVAVGAEHARAAHGLRRIAIVDFDVHHGNGTQAMVWDDPDLFYASTHQMPLYPGTGSPEEQGAHDNVANAPLRTGSGSAEFRRAIQEIVIPRIFAFAPELILVSAGFDAHRADPLAGLALEDEDFGWVTRELAAVAAEVCGGRLVSALEGGYDQDALARSCEAHVRALMAG